METQDQTDTPNETPKKEPPTADGQKRRDMIDAQKEAAEEREQEGGYQ